MKRNFSKALALFLAVVMSLPLSVFASLGVFATTDSTTNTMSEPQLIDMPSVTYDADKVVYWSNGTAGKKDGSSPTDYVSAFATASGSALYYITQKGGGTIVMPKKGYIAASSTFDVSALSSPVMFTGRVDTNGDGTFEEDYVTTTGRNDTNGQAGMFMVNSNYSVTFAGEIIFANTVLIDRNTAVSNKCWTLNVASNGTVLIEDTVQITHEYDGAMNPALSVQSGGKAILKSVGFSSYSGTGTIYVDTKLMDDDTVALLRTFVAGGGTVLDLYGNNPCQLVGHDYTTVLKDSTIYNVCDACAHEEEHTYAIPVLTNTTTKHYVSANHGNTGDGSAITAPKYHTISAAMGVVAEGGTIIAVGKLNQSDPTGSVFTASSPVKFTAVDGEYDCREQNVAGFENTDTSQFGAIMWGVTSVAHSILTFGSDVIFEDVNVYNRYNQNSLKVTGGATAYLKNVEFKMGNSAATTTHLIIDGGSTVILDENVGPIASVTGKGLLVVDQSLIDNGSITAAAIADFDGVVVTEDNKVSCALSGHVWEDDSCARCGTEKLSVTKVYVSGSGTGNGQTADAPTSDIVAAFSTLSDTDVEVILVGDLTVNTQLVFPASKQNVKITSIDTDDDGVYPKIIIKGSFVFENDGDGKTITFENIEFNINRKTALPIFGTYNNITFGDGITCTAYDSDCVDTIAFYAGHFETYGDNTPEGKSNEYNTTITVKSGKFESIIGGNRRNSVTTGSSTFYATYGYNSGDMIINISGGEIVGNAKGIAVAGTGDNFYGGNIAINVTGGNIGGGIYGVSNLTTYYARVEIENGKVTKLGFDGDIAISVAGAQLGGNIYARYPSMEVVALIRGDVNVTLGNGNTLPEGFTVDLRSTVAKDNSGKVSKLTYDTATYTVATSYIDFVNDVATNAGEPKRVAFIGDSITQGTGSTDRGTKSYPALLSQYGDLSDYLIADFGVGGTAVLPNGSWWKNTMQYRLALDFAPEIVSVALGTNDAHTTMKSYGAALNFQNHYYTLLHEFASLETVTELYAATTLYRMDISARMMGDVGAVNPSIRNVVKKLKTDFTGKSINLFELGAITSEQLLLGNILGNDKLHPNDDGYVIMAQTFYNAIFADTKVLDVPDGYYLDTIYVSDSGTLSNAGTIDAPISSLAFALERANKSGAKIIIDGTYTLEHCAMLPMDITGTLTIEGKGEGAKLVWNIDESESEDLVFRLGCDTVFNNLHLEATTHTTLNYNTPTIIGHFHNVTFTDSFTSSTTNNNGLEFVAGNVAFGNITTTYPNKTYTFEMTSTYDSLESTSSDRDIIININGGTFGNVIFGNRRSSAYAPIGTYSGVMTVNLNGGKITGKVASTSHNGAMSAIQLTGTMTVNFSGIELDNSVVFYAMPRTATLSGGITYDSALNTGKLVINAPSSILFREGLIVENQNRDGQIATIADYTLNNTDIDEVPDGDIDGDKEITNIDITLLVRHLANHPIGYTLEKANADKDANGDINNQDVLQLIFVLSNNIS